MAVALVGCAPAAPRELEKCGSTILAGKVQSKCYELGQAEFRGVLWPTVRGGDFSVLLVTSRREYDFDIPGPAFGWGQNVTEVRPASSVPDTDNNGWDIRLFSTTFGTQLTVRLPQTRTPYIYELHLEGKAEALTFMNPSETVYQRGIFGYVLVTDPARTHH
jgi:hypothetical protein